MTNSEEQSFRRISSTNRPAARAYSIMVIRQVGKGGYSSASAINNFAQIVGHGADDGKVRTRAFAWSNEYGLITDLGATYAGDSFATNINDKGVIVGYTSTNENSLRAFLLGQGHMFDLGLLSPVAFDEAFSVATDINENGSIVGYSSTGRNVVHGYCWQHDKGMTDIGSFADGPSYAYSINDFGVAVGWSQLKANEGYRAFQWSEENGLTELDSPQGASSVAYAVNKQGVIAGASARSSRSTLLEGAIWKSSKMQHTGTIEDFSFSACHGLNENGQAVGWAYPKSQCDVKFGRATIWDETQGIQDLNALIPAGTGWILHKAVDVNNDGDIVGCGTYEGKLQSFLLTPVDYAREVSNLIELQQLNLITNRKSGVVYRTIIIKNISHRPIRGPINLVFQDLNPWISVIGAGGTINDAPFRTVNVDIIVPGSTISTTVQFSNPNDIVIAYNCACYSGSF